MINFSPIQIQPMFLILSPSLQRRYSAFPYSTLSDQPSSSMASTSLLLPLSLFSFLCLATTFQAQTIIPVAKDVSTLQYLTQIYLTDALLPTKFVLDLNGPHLWLSRHSSTAKPVPRRSIRCLLAAKPDGDGSSRDSGNDCRVLSQNSLTGLASISYLQADTVAVDSSDRSPIPAFHRFLFSFSPDSLLSGLASGAEGMMGLGRSRIALPEQVAADRRFFLCLSASDGVVVVGGDDLPYISPLSSLWADVSRSLTYTPLLAGESNDYRVDLKSVKVNGERVALNSPSMQMLLSTVVPYTTMESSIYRTFLEAYAIAAAAANLTRAAAVAPFELCFRSEGVETTALGPAVPAIDLVLQSEMVRWRIHGQNSMVRVSEEAICLAFLDGGESAATAVVLGGHQLEDVLLGFDLGASMVGFSSSLSLLMNQRSCSDFSNLQIIDKSFCSN